MTSKSCLDATSGNKFKVASNNLNGLASAIKQEIHTDNEAGNLWHAGIIIIIQQHLCHFINTFKSLCAKPQDFTGSYLLNYREVRHSSIIYSSFRIV